MKLLIVGRTGAGKDCLRGMLEERGLSFVKSYSTRPPRTPDEDTHLFVTPEQADELMGRGHVVTRSVINGNEYFSTIEEVRAHDAYIIDPHGLHELCARMPWDDFMVVYLRAPKAARRRAAMGRVGTEARNEELRTFERRDADEDGQFSAFERELASGGVRRIPNVFCVRECENDYDPASMRTLASEIADAMRAHDHEGPRVQLIAHTPCSEQVVATAARTCYSKDDPQRLWSSEAVTGDKAARLIRRLRESGF